MIELYDYQDNAVQAIRRFFTKGGKHVLLQAPTGAGKTIIFSYMAQNAAIKHKKVLILTDRVELLMQTGGTLAKFGVKPFSIVAGTKFINFGFTIYVAMCQTLRNRIKIPLWAKFILKDIDLVIIDECHKQDFNYLFESGLLDKKLVIGFTATPKRGGKMRQLALDYEEIIESVSVPELINRGYLVSDDYYGVAGANLNSIKVDSMKGDYSESDMFNRFNSSKLYAGVVKNWIEVAKNTHTIVFCVNIEHVIHTCEEFHKNGIDARFVVSSMSKPKEPEKEAAAGIWTRYQERMRLYSLYLDSFGKWSGERSYIVNKFKQKEFPVLINGNILTTGFDCPEVETVIVNRATLSVVLWLQMIGRGSRISPGKTHFNILDFGENASRLGHYTMPQNWQLWHENKNSEDGVAPVKDCGRDNNGQPLPKDKNDIVGCGRMILSSLMICPFCGFMYAGKKAKEIDLEAIMYDTVMHVAKPVKKISQMDTDELFDYYKSKKHKPAWLWRQLYFRGGVALLEEFGKEKGWKKGTRDKAINFVSGL
jgi:superfamily II DNA or RNA helicase